MEQKIKALRIESKYEMLMELEKGTKSKTELAENYGIPKSTLSGIIKKKAEIITSFQATSMSPSRKRHRSGTYDDVDNALYAWFKDARSNNLPLSGPFLRQKADDLARKLGHLTFQASTGWIDRFKQRHNIVCRSISGESGSAPVDDVTEWKERKLESLIKEYEPSDIFNADETGLFYKFCHHTL